MQIINAAIWALFAFAGAFALASIWADLHSAWEAYLRLMKERDDEDL